jgi:hypothetical protein
MLPWYGHLFLVLVYITAVLLWLRHMAPAKRQRLARGVQSLWAWMVANAQELVGIPAALLVFYGSGIALRWLEPASAIYDAGVLQGVTVVIVHLLVGNSVARLGTKLNQAWFYKDQPINQSDRQWLYVIYLAAYCLLAAVL